MRAMLLTAAVLAGGSALAADDLYDLRGPAPKVKQVLTTKATFRVIEAKVSISDGDKVLEALESTTVDTEEEETILEVKDREITKSETKVLNDRTSTTTNIGGRISRETEVGDLNGETVQSVKQKGEWTHKIDKEEVTDEQKKALAKRNGPESDDEQFPAEKVKVGHEWTIDAAKARSLTGNQYADVKGKLAVKFLRVEKVGDEECAVIETKGTFTGTVKPEEKGDPVPAVEMTVTATGWRSLKTGVEVMGKTEGKLKIEGKQKLDGKVVEISMSGRIEGEGTTTLK